MSKYFRTTDHKITGSLFIINALRAFFVFPRLLHSAHSFFFTTRINFFLFFSFNEVNSIWSHDVIWVLSLKKKHLKSRILVFVLVYDLWSSFKNSKKLDHRALVIFVGIIWLWSTYEKITSNLSKQFSSAGWWLK